MVYEYLVTLRREVELFWNHKWTGAAVLFYFNRYLSLLVNVYGLVASDAHTSVQVRKTIRIRVLLSLTPARSRYKRYAESLLVRYVQVLGNSNESRCSCAAGMKAYKIIEVLQYLPWAGM